MIEFTISSGNTQVTHHFPHELRSEELADLLKILAICLYDVEINDALIQLEILRQCPNFFAYSEEDIA